jgi:hypothetical protein
VAPEQVLVRCAGGIGFAGRTVVPAAAEVVPRRRHAELRRRAGPAFLQ